MGLVTLNVGGTIFEITGDCLRKYPQTRLGKLSTSCKEYIPERKQYFFNRNPDIFNSILDLYRIGSLHLPTTICGAILRKELEFWEISIELLSECCVKTYFKYESDVEKIEAINKVFESENIGYRNAACENSKWIRFKRNVWLFVDQPTSSLPAKIFASIFMMVVVLSVLLTAMEIVPHFRQNIYTHEQLEHFRNTSTFPEILKRIDMNNPKIVTAVNSFLLDWTYYFEIFINGFFSLEFLIHFGFCPNKIKFFHNFFNVLDAILFASMWTAFSIYNSYQDYKSLLENRVVGILFAIFISFTTLRLLKIFRLLKNCPGLLLLCMSVRWSIKDFLLLFTTFMAISCLFGVVIFACELNERTTFPNMFIGIWWAAITMTTVGYGDHYPMSFPGCIVGICCAICGLMFLALPVALLSSNFNECLERYNERKRFLSYKEKTVFLELDNKQQGSML